MQYRTGLLIGRFQPFHKGHLYLIKEALRHVQSLIIGIGSSNTVDEKNPISFEDRKKILEEVFKKENLIDKIIKIFPIPDDPSDDVWLKNVMKSVDNFDLYIGNDEWTTGIFKKAGFTVLRIPYLRRDIYEGTLIREIMKKGNSWKDRVPDYLIKLIEESFLFK